MFRDVPGRDSPTSIARHSEADIPRVGLHACWSLVRGVAPSFSPAGWERILHRVLMERCAPLAWARNHAHIEAEAPRTVAVTWAASAWDAEERAAVQLAALGEVTSWFGAHHVDYAVLKGIPLSQRLYNLFWARPSDDIDIYVDPASSRSALQVLEGTGWRLLSGSYPHDIALQKIVNGRIIMLDLHFSLAGPWHRHLPFGPFDVETVHIEGVPMRTLSIEFLPAYLAAHMMQHGNRPLLWLSDFATLQSSLTESEWKQARVAAHRARLGKVLSAAEAWVGELDAMNAAMSEEAEQATLRKVLRPGNHGTLAQILVTTSSVRDIGALLRQFLWPAELRSSARHFFSLWGRRLGRRVLRRNF